MFYFRFTPKTPGRFITSEKVHPSGAVHIHASNQDKSYENAAELAYPEGCSWTPVDRDEYEYILSLWRTRIYQAVKKLMKGEISPFICDHVVESYTLAEEVQKLVHPRVMQCETDEVLKDLKFQKQYGIPPQIGGKPCHIWIMPGWNERLMGDPVGYLKIRVEGREQDCESF